MSAELDTIEESIKIALDAADAATDITSEIGKEISEKLYSAVAVALAYIYKIDKGELVDEPQIDIPEDLRFNENGKAMKYKD